MRFLRSFFLTVAASAALAACGGEGGNTTQTEAAEDAAGDNTLNEMLGNEGSSFAAAAKAAGLDATLSGPGPYTLFVPTNAAFEKLPDGAMDSMMRPEARAQLTKLLSNHILSGAVLAEDVSKAIDNGKGKTQLMTVGGGTLTATKDGDNIILTDEAGGRAVIVNADSKGSNGVLHRIDGVLMPAA